MHRNYNCQSVKVRNLKTVYVIFEFMYLFKTMSELHTKQKRSLVFIHIHNDIYTRMICI